jgi:hypothetical protein
MPEPKRSAELSLRARKQFDTTEADAIAFLNAALDIRRLAPAVPDAQRAIRRLKSKPKPVARSLG